VFIAHILYTGKCVYESRKIAVWFILSNVENLKKILPVNPMQIEALSFSNMAQ
jgi:hypothetical protein